MTMDLIGHMRHISVRKHIQFSISVCKNMGYNKVNNLQTIMKVTVKVNTDVIITYPGKDSKYRPCTLRVHITYLSCNAGSKLLYNPHDC